MILQQEIHLQRSGTDSQHGPIYRTDEGVVIDIENAGAHVAHLVKEILPYLQGGRSLTISLSVDPSLVTLGQEEARETEAGRRGKRG